MPTTPRLTQRYERQVELVFRDQADVAAYQVQAANTLDLAFAGATSMFTLARGATLRSPTIQRRRLGLSEPQNRGLSRAFYDPEDYWAPAGQLPHDAAASYLNVRERSAAGVLRPAGPILIVPPPGFFVTTRPSLTIAGTAPNVAASATGNPPDGALRFVLPRFADSTTIANRGGATLFVSFNPGLPEFQVASMTTAILPDAAVSEVFVRGSGATVAFTMYFAIVNAEMA